MKTHGGHFRAFTLPELTAVIVIIAIVGATLIPTLTANMKSSRLPSAASVVASDLEYCESLNISNPAAPCVFRADPVNCHYWIALASSPNTAITHPGDGLPYDQIFGTGRLAALQGVLLASVTLPNGTNVGTEAFDTFGRPSNGTDLSIVVSLNGTTMHVNMRGDTGDVSIVSP
jgi:prepilin-type N-terminal cleavage/methylation domain-containing protein